MADQINSSDDLKQLIDSRRSVYPPMVEDFSRVARMAGALSFCPSLAAQHVLYMILVKVSRLIHNPSHTDSWRDVAGYAACGDEVTKDCISIARISFEAEWMQWEEELTACKSVVARKRLRSILICVSGLVVNPGSSSTWNALCSHGLLGMNLIGETNAGRTSAANESTARQATPASQDQGEARSDLPGDSA